MPRALLLLASLWLPACSATPEPWGTDLAAELAASRDEERDTVVFLALPGRELSDRMERRVLATDEVRSELARGSFRSARVDAAARPNLYSSWIGGGEGMGIALIDPAGRCWAARPGPQDPPELAAFLRLCAARRPQVASARARLSRLPDDPDAQFQLGALLLELGSRKAAEPLLVTAAPSRPQQAALLLALLHGQDGQLEAARQWLRHVPPGAPAQVVDGYLCFKERRHEEAVRLLQSALAAPLSDREALRARLYLGKALGECGRKDEALQVLRSLAAEHPGTVAAGAALHAIAHLQDPTHGHDHGTRP